MNKFKVGDLLVYTDYNSLRIVEEVESRGCYILTCQDTNSGQEVGERMTITFETAHDIYSYSESHIVNKILTKYYEI